MGELEGHNIPGQRHAMEQLANSSISSIIMVISRGAMMLVAGILIWGFNRLDASIVKLNETISSVAELQGRHDERIKWHDQRLQSLERAAAMDRQRP